MSHTQLVAGVDLRGLRKGFAGPQGTVQAVDGVDLTIAAGETVALLGPNGAGKSTTVDLMIGLLRPDAGSVTLFGRSPAKAVDAGLIGAMLQGGAVLRDLTVRELLDMMRSLFPNPLTVDETLRLAGVDDIADRMTHKLSGGQTQRVRFAVALVSDPDLLVLDEPTVAMDVEARRDFWATMRQFTSRGKTVVFATHYLEEADAYADRIVLMAHGRIVADGPSTEIKATVGNRIVRATLPRADLADLADLGGLPGVLTADLRGEAVALTCTDSDSALRALLDRYPAARDIEVTSPGLEQAFLHLTRDGAEDEATAHAEKGRG